jgi:hypothetical protein
MVPPSLHASLRRLLRPLVRILLRYGVAFGDFRDIARQVFVEVADADFSLPNRKQSLARIAMLTGIQRKEVGRLLRAPPRASDPQDQRYNRGVRVIGGWRRDPDFLTPRGEPAALPLEGASGFFALVRRYSGDLTGRAVLDELERVGLVRRDALGRVELVVAAGYVPFGDRDARFNILGSCVADLFHTLEHNLEAPEGATRLQLTTAYDNLPAEAAAEFRGLARERCLALLKELDAWLAARDRDASPQAPPGRGPRTRAGIGLYHIEEPWEEPPS